MQINGVTILHDHRQCTLCLKECVNFQINVKINKDCVNVTKYGTTGFFIYKNFNNKCLLRGNEYGLIKAQYSNFCKYYFEMLS